MRAGARAAGASGGGDLGHVLRSFNRFELKYAVSQELAGRLRHELATRLDTDAHARRGDYTVWSLYYDTTDLRFYWEKIEGIRFRRKLRVRHYGRPEELELDTPVWVEIKQRVNRVTQKRRARLAYRDALAVCAGEDPGDHDPADDSVIEEVQALVSELGARPTTITGYVREPFVGRDEESGLRVTIDSRIRGRDRDLDLRRAGENRLIVRPDLSVVEVKVNERAPYWLTDHIARHDMQLIRISKYCQSVEAFGRAPRSIFHLPDDRLGRAA